MALAPVTPQEVVGINQILENLDENGTGELLDTMWRSFQLQSRNGRVGAMAEVDIPLLPAIEPESSGLSKTDYRKFAGHAIKLAGGEEGAFAHMVESMVENNAGGFENRFSSLKGEEGKNRENFVAIHNTFCRTVNSNENDESLPGRQRGMDDFMSKFVWNWWVPGMVVTLHQWGKRPIPGLKYKAFDIPLEMSILDPLRIDLDDLVAKNLVYYEYPDKKQKDALIAEINLYGGIDKHPFFLLYPDKVDPKDPKQKGYVARQEAFALFSGKSKLPLPQGYYRLIRRSFSNELYPVPFAYRIFSGINDKRLLRQMDRSLMQRVIMMILVILVKAQDKTRGVKRGDLDRTISEMEEHLSADPEFLHVLALPEGADMKWVTPDPTAILNPDRYRTVDFEILSSLIGIIASQILNNSGALDLQVVGEQLWRKNQLCVRDFTRFLEEIYDQISKRNKLKALLPGMVKVVPKPFTMFQSDAFRAFIGNMVMRGLFPVEIAADHIGEDFTSMVDKLIIQVNMMKEHGIFTAPVSNVQISDNKETKDGPSPGRPPGEPDEDQRERDNENEEDMDRPSEE